MGASKTPTPATPGEAAQAAMGTAAAGEQMSIADQPIEQAANLQTTEQLGPAQMQTQQALAGQSAYQGAEQQQDIQSRLDPQAYAQRQMRMQAANQRLGQLYGQDPSTFSFRAPGAYTVPGSSATPDPQTLANQAQAMASLLSVGSVNKQGADPTLLTPTNAKATQGNAAQTYLS
jgi:hypothetical protein